MSKTLNFMMAIALTTVAGSAMANTVSIGTLSPGSFLTGGGSFSPDTTVDLAFNVTGVSHAGYQVSSATNSVTNSITSASLWNFDGTNTTTKVADLVWNSTLRQFDTVATLWSGLQYALVLTGYSNGGYSYGFVSNEVPSAVPLPPAAILFGTALLGVAGLGRKKRETEVADAVAA